MKAAVAPARIEEKFLEVESSPKKANTTAVLGETPDIPMCRCEYCGQPVHAFSGGRKVHSDTRFCRATCRKTYYRWNDVALCIPVPYGAGGVHFLAVDRRGFIKDVSSNNTEGQNRAHRKRVDPERCAVALTAFVELWFRWLDEQVVSLALTEIASGCGLALPLDSRSFFSPRLSKGRVRLEFVAESSVAPTNSLFFGPQKGESLPEVIARLKKQCTQYSAWLTRNYSVDGQSRTIYRSVGLTDHARSLIVRNVRWFYRNTFLGESIKSLARKYHEETHPDTSLYDCDDRRTIRDGINAAKVLFHVLRRSEVLAAIRLAAFSTHMSTGYRILLARLHNRPELKHLQHFSEIVFSRAYRPWAKTS
jgi:hypothetical protein